MNLTMMSFRSGIATSWQGADGRVKCVHRLVLRQDRRSRPVARRGSAAAKSVPGSLLQLFDFPSHRCQQRWRQFGIAFLNCKSLAVRVHPFQQIA